MKKCVACQRKSSLCDRVRTFFVPKRKEVTCSHHLNLTILKWGLPAQLPFRAKLKQAIPACPAVLFYPVTDLFCAIMHIFYIFFFLLSEY